MMDDPVVMAAQEGEVVELRLTAVDPVEDVVGVAHGRWSGAAGERAVSVADDEGGPDRGGDQAAEPAEVEDLGVGAEDGGDDLGVTRESAEHGGR